MKKSLIILSLMLASLSSQGTTNSQTEYLYQPGETVLKGLRVGIVTSNPSIKFSVGNESEISDIDPSVGISVGYGSVTNGAIGLIYELTFTNLNVGGDQSILQSMLQVGGTYGLSEKSFVMAGLNFGKFSDEDLDTDLGLGFQVGVGYQFTQQLGLHAKLYRLNSKMDTDYDFDVDIESSALELGLSATF